MSVREAITIMKYIREYHSGDISRQTVRYNMKHGKIDYFKVGGRHLVLLTDKSINFKPNLKHGRLKKAEKGTSRKKGG